MEIIAAGGTYLLIAQGTSDIVPLTFEPVNSQIRAEADDSESVKTEQTGSFSALQCRAGPGRSVWLEHDEWGRAVYCEAGEGAGDHVMKGLAASGRNVGLIWVQWKSTEGLKWRRDKTNLSF